MKLDLLCNSVALKELASDDFHVSIDESTGAVLSITDPKATTSLNWVSSPANAPWLPSGSRWGLGFANVGSASLYRSHWCQPQFSVHTKTTNQINYTLDSLKVLVSRRLDQQAGTFTESYIFRNTGNAHLNLSGRGKTSFAIYTPFNDHYTNTNDALQNRCHAHVWANGGSTAWVKLQRMGGNGRDLGLVLSKGALAGYSIESRDTITSSNTRGVFLLHPSLPSIAPGHEVVLEWTLFWHLSWDDFFRKCAALSTQFIRFDVPNYTLVLGESVSINMTGVAINSSTTVNGKAVTLNGSGATFVHDAENIGQKELVIATRYGEHTYKSTIFLNTVPGYDELIVARIKFIVNYQQVTDKDSRLDGAYVVYDNQMKKQVTFDRENDRNAGRERVGMGVLIGRWLQKHNDHKVRTSMISYYTFVCTQLQDTNGFVLNGPGDRTKRLYNWPWVMQLHLIVATLGLKLTGPIAEKTPMQRFMMTLENYYAEGGTQFYPIGLPIFESLHILHSWGDAKSYERALSLFTAHGEYIVQQGTNYPASEVNFEQSIVAPAAIILLELHRATKQGTWLQSAHTQIEILLRFAGKQPDYRMHDISIRHWDSYWFGKDRMWGDTFPHYWSTLNALALHHYGKIIRNPLYEKRADSVIRANLALFTPTGRGSCAWVYPLSVNGREGHYLDPYANDQDWALAHLLQISELII